MADIRIDFEGNAADLIRELGKVQAELGDVEHAAENTGDEFGQLGAGAVGGASGVDVLKRGAIALGGVLAASQVKDFVVDSTNLAVAAEEAGNKFDAVFGPAASGLAGDLAELGDKAGITDFRLQDIVATAGNVIQGLGGTRAEAAEMAAALAPLAIDVASFNGSIADAPEALQSMTSALTGNRESLKDRWGIVVREAEVIQRALELSFKDSASELTELEKAQATYSLIVERSGNAVGDLDRNLDSAATTQARLQAEWEEAQVQLGNELLPMLIELQQALIDLVPVFEGLVAQIRNIAEPIAGVVAGISDLGDAVDEGNIPVEESIGLFQRLGDVAAELAITTNVMRRVAERTTEAQWDNTRSVEAATERWQGLADMHAEAEAQAEETRTGTFLLKDAIDEANASTSEAIELEGTLAELRNAQVSALGKVKKAQEDVTEARQDLLDLETNPGATEDEVAAAAWRLVDAETTLAAVMEEFAENQGPLYTDALIDIGREAGLAGDALWAFVEAALAAQGIGTPSGGGVTEVGGVGVITPVPQQHGGVHRARRGGNIVQVAEAGTDEAIIPLNSQGIGAIADAFNQALGGAPGVGGGGPTFVINVQGFVGSEMALAAEIDRILTRRKRSSGLELL